MIGRKISFVFFLFAWVFASIVFVQTARGACTNADSLNADLADQWFSHYYKFIGHIDSAFLIGQGSDSDTEMIIIAVDSAIFGYNWIPSVKSIRLIPCKGDGYYERLPEDSTIGTRKYLVLTDKMITYSTDNGIGILHDTIPWSDIVRDGGYCGTDENAFYIQGDSIQNPGKYAGCKLAWLDFMESVQVKNPIELYKWSLGLKGDSIDIIFGLQDRYNARDTSGLWTPAPWNFRFACDSALYSDSMAQILSRFQGEVYLKVKRNYGSEGPAVSIQDGTAYGRASGEAVCGSPGNFYFYPRDGVAAALEQYGWVYAIWGYPMTVKALAGNAVAPSMLDYFSEEVIRFSLADESDTAVLYLARDYFYVKNENSTAAGELENGITAFPNPFNPKTSIRLLNNNDGTVNGPARLKVFDIKGTVVFHALVQADQLKKGITWDAGSLSSGLYIVEVVAGNRQFRKKLVLQR